MADRVKVIVLFQWTCPTCGRENRGQHDPREELVTCPCGFQGEAVEAHPDVPENCLNPNRHEGPESWVNGVCRRCPDPEDLDLDDWFHG
ncbi:hypothetical protein [Nocardioides sp. YR527]|uniref:hypothetical protein n=1 Tax=Nocardioides sp. YR527 TaxID=1881028 RepID=UPI00115FAFDD|nr:hypothetical protein [Nocardioides sp. YR527]